MPKRVGAHGLPQAGPAERLVERLLNHRLVRVVAMLDSRAPAEVARRSGQDPLPAALSRRVRKLPCQGTRQRRLPQARPQILFVLPPNVS